jgi:phosphoglycerate dehydrogenase-like enzyme
MITPHAAGHSDGNAARVNQMFFDNLKRWFTAQPLNNRVNPIASD